MESFWLFITNLGRDEVFIIALTLYTLLVYPHWGRQLGLIFTLSFLLNTALKYGLYVPRPFAEQPELVSAAAEATAGGPSMPSGHAQMGVTLWLGMAAQIQRPFWWGAFGVLALLIAWSRLVLQVHRPLEVGVGVVLGLGFVWLAWWLKGRADVLGSPKLNVRYWGWLPLIVAGFIETQGLSDIPSEFIVGLSMLSGFWFARPNFEVPQTWQGRLIVGFVGVLIVLLVYFGLSAVSISLGRHQLPIDDTARYVLLVLTVFHVVPPVLRRWLPVSAPLATEAISETTKTSSKSENL